MVKPRIIIADTDSSYVMPLLAKFAYEFFNKITIEFIDDEDYFKVFFSTPQSVDILIVSEDLYDLSLKKHDIAHIFVMTEHNEPDSTSDLSVNRLFKYSSVKEVYNEIVGKSADSLHIEDTKAETRVIMVCSASGGTGKTTVALHMVAEVQKRGGIAGFIDAEHALDPVYAKNIGVDIDNLYISQPDNGEQAMEITETMVRSGAVDIVIVDSVAALVPKAEIDGDMGDSHVGLQARLMSQALRKLTGVMSKSNCTVIFINQLREKIGVMFGNPETTTGGRALKFYASVRLDVRRIDSLKQSGEVIGNRVRVKVVKNKIAPPFKEAEFDIMFGKGISREGDILDLAAKEDIIEKSGAWYAYQGAKIGQGRENAKNYLAQNPAVMAEVEAKVREAHGLPADPAAAAAGAAGAVSAEEAE